MPQPMAAGADSFGAAPRPPAGGSRANRGFVVRVRPEKREQYLELHRAVWPRVEQAMRECNIRNYSIFIVDDVLFGTYEYVGEDYDADMARMRRDPASREWWSRTDTCQVPFGTAPRGTLWREMQLVWHSD